MDKKLQFKIFIRALFLQVGWNYRKMQNIGFAFSLLPALKQIYIGDRLNDAIIRHLDYFNTQPNMAGFTIGLCVKLEQQASKLRGQEEISAHEKIKSLKYALSTSTAAIGDRLFWGTLKPFSLALSLFIMFAAQPNFINLMHGSFRDVLITVLALLAGFLFYNTVGVYIRWKSLEHGYKCAQDRCCGMDFINWNGVIKKLRFFGLILVLASTILFLNNYVSFVFSL